MASTDVQTKGPPAHLQITPDPDPPTGPARVRAMGRLPSAWYIPLQAPHHQTYFKKLGLTRQNGASAQCWPRLSVFAWSLGVSKLQSYWIDLCDMRRAPMTGTYVPSPGHTYKCPPLPLRYPGKCWNCCYRTAAFGNI